MTGDPELIFHITTSREWEAACVSGMYSGSTRGKSLAEVGFVHCSQRGQISGVANARYRGEPDLILLAIDPARLTAPVRVEGVHGSAEFFPHIYGPLNIDAVVDVLQFRPGPDGMFELPEVLR